MVKHHSNGYTPEIEKQKEEQWKQLAEEKKLELMNKLCRELL